VFQQSFRRATRPYTLGLSATPFRKDGLDALLGYYIGPMAHMVELKVPDDVEVALKPFNTAWPVAELTRTGTVCLPKAINQLVAMEPRNAFLIDIIKEAMQSSREILVLSDRREHCKQLEAMVGAPAKTAVLIGGCDPSKVDGKQVIFATYALCAEGFDVPRLSTLVMATPRADVVQACGRVMRSGNSRKHSPLIVDVADSWGIFYGQTKKRMSYYQKSGFSGLPREPERKKAKMTRSEISTFFCGQV
jgi:superfamily II DNA or RNA helicase